MAIKHKITYSAPEGAEFISIDDWAKTALLEEEYKEFIEARDRDIALTQATATSIDIESGESIFDNEEKMNAGVHNNDPQFLLYFGRYLIDTGTKISEITENV
jgi:hypothetical protein